MTNPPNLNNARTSHKGSPTRAAWRRFRGLPGKAQAAIAVLLIGGCAVAGGTSSEPVATEAPAPAQSSTAGPSSAKPAEPKPDTADAVVARMDCTSRSNRAQLEADAMTPGWVGPAAKSVASCQHDDFTMAVVVEYGSKDEALQAVARAQDSTGWKNRVTVDGRFARGASGQNWTAVDFPEIQQ